MASRYFSNKPKVKMSTLICRVETVHPVALVTLAGTLDDRSAPAARSVLRGCLAEMPAALLLDVTDLTIESRASLSWLEELAEQAAIWPAAPVCLCGAVGWNEGLIEQSGLPSYRSVSAAIAAWSNVVPTQRESIILPLDPQSCGRARDFVTRVCADWGVRRPVRLAQLLVSELVANSVTHARTGLAVSVRRFGQGIEVSVRDDGLGQISDPLPQDPRGFGLQLVDAMSDAWGSAPTDAGKVVWTRLAG